MKRFLVPSFLASLLLVISAPIAHASDNHIESMLIGGAGGALVGQAIGRNMESTLIGAAIGSVVGFAAQQSTHRLSPPHTARYSTHRMHNPPVRTPYYHPPRKHHPKWYRCRHRHHRHWKLRNRPAVSIRTTTITTTITPQNGYHPIHFEKVYRDNHKRRYFR